MSLIQDQRVAVSYMVQAVAMFDHYAFRDALSKTKTATEKLYLKEPPKNPEIQPGLPNITRIRVRSGTGNYFLNNPSGCHQPLPIFTHRA